MVLKKLKTIICICECKDAQGIGGGGDFWGFEVGHRMQALFLVYSLLNGSTFVYHGHVQFSE